MADSPEFVVRTLYELISGPADEPRDWEAVAGLFLPGARLLSELETEEGVQHGFWTVETFIEEAAREYSRSGFWEREIAADVKRFGNVANVWSTYETRVGKPDGPPSWRGLNSVQLLRRGGRWWITEIVFQVEAGDLQLPD